MNCKDSKSFFAVEKHNLRINCINPYLVSLPEKLLITPAKSLASSILSTAIERKHHKEVLKKSQLSPNSILSSTGIKFELGGTKSIINNPKFKELKSETAVKVENFFYS